MKLRAFLQDRRRRRARKRYEREKALRESRQDHKGMERAANLGGIMGSGGPPGA